MQLRPALILAVALLVSCGSIPQTRYYSLTRPEPSAAPDSRSEGLSLGVNDFRAEGLYLRDNLLYREGAFEINPDYYRRWSSPPHKMLAEATVDYLRSRGMFGQVYRLPFMGRVDLVLDGRIVRFEQISGDAEGDRVRVDLEFNLSDPRSHERLWSAEIGNSQPLTAPFGAVDIVAAMQKAVDVCLTEAAGSISGYISSPGFTER